jgi:[acyl-carrier-protein] S-malonyltransferase
VTQSKFALVFPGQGSQSVGMLDALAAAEPIVGRCFAEASDALGYDLWQVVSSGPEERLNATERTQPALLAAGIAVWRVWQQRGAPQPVALAGHSLGEYTALVAAGSIGFADALRLVEFRGQAMQAAVPAGTGAMAAILGLDDEAVRAACAESAQGAVVSAVNFNSPGQVVIAGEKAAVERAIEACKAKGAKRAVPLPVSVPSHCALMRPAADRLAERLAGIAVAAPALPVVHNVDVASHSDPAAIRRALVAQLHSPVRWVECVQALKARGATRLVECGPGKVLAGLTKRIDKEVEGLAAFDPATIDAAIAAVRA